MLKINCPVSISWEKSLPNSVFSGDCGVPIPKPSRDCEVVIVGGGIGGLSAAYELRDMNILVIEKEKRVGGHARCESWKGIWYSEGVLTLRNQKGSLRGLSGTLKPFSYPLSYL